MDNVFCNIQNAKVRLQKERKRTYFLKIQRGCTSQHTKKKTAGDTHQLKIIEREISGYGRQAKEIHLLPRQSKRKVVRIWKENQ